MPTLNQVNAKEKAPILKRMPNIIIDEGQLSFCQYLLSQFALQV
jgi:hypothetical protein